MDACSFNCHAPKREVDAGACRGMNEWMQIFRLQDGNPSFENIRGRKWDGKFRSFLIYFVFNFFLF